MKAADSEEKKISQPDALSTHHRHTQHLGTLWWSIKMETFWVPASFAPFLPWLLQRSQRWKGSHLTFDLLDCEMRSQLVAGAGPLSAEMLPVLGSAWGIAASRRCAKCDPSNVSVSLWIFFTSKKNGSSATTAFSLCTFQTTVADTWSQPRPSHQPTRWQIL